MNARHRATVADLYQTDLERHMFAMERRPRRSSRPTVDVMSEWLRDWLSSGLARCRTLAEAMYLL